MGEKHSAVCYIFREGAFTPVQETKPLRNDFGLDLFQYKGAVYEGKTGLHLCPARDAEYLALFIKSHGGIEYAERRMEELRLKCMEYIENAVSDEGIKRALTAYIDFVIERNN